MCREGKMTDGDITLKLVEISKNGVFDAEVPAMEVKDEERSVPVLS